MLRADAAERERMAAEIVGVSRKLDQTKHKMDAVAEAIDEIVAEGLGLSPREHDLVRKRCAQFPLSATVERPRHAWNADRKRQGRRLYDAGEQFQ